MYTPEQIRQTEFITISVHFFLFEHIQVKQCEQEATVKHNTV